MVVTKGQAIGFVVVSLLQLAVGIAGIVLSKFYFAAAAEAYTSNYPTLIIGVWWVFGLPYLVPPIFGFLAAGCRNNGTVAAYMTFNIIILVVSGVFAVFFLLFLTSVIAYGGITCAPLGAVCVCRSGIYSSLSTSFDVEDPNGVCDSVNTGISLLYGIAAMVVIGWALCLVASILCCVSCCCSRERSTDGVVFAQSSPGYEMSVPGPAYAQGDPAHVKNANY